MDQEVAKTLGNLELKLAELERELTSIGRRGAEPASTPGKLIDEAIEHETPADTQQPTEPAHQQDERHGSASTDELPPTPAAAERVWEPENGSHHAHSAYAAPAPPSQPTPPPFEPAHSFEAQRVPPPPAPQPPAPFEERQSIDIADLVRFRDKLAHTMDELIDEYSRLLSLQPPTSSRRSPDA